MRIRVSITDYACKTFEGEMELASKSKKKRNPVRNREKSWYDVGSTIHIIVNLLDEGFFDINRTLSDVIAKFRTMDYNFKSSDLTLLLRKMVQHGLLKKTKSLTDGAQSKNWIYIRG